MNRSIAAAWLVFILAGCGNSLSPFGAPDHDGVIVGDITMIDDNVPADGGVTIRVQTSDDEEVETHFPSLFTYPPPSPERHAVYEKITRLRVGDRVMAVVKDSDGLLTLLDIRRL